MGLRACACQRLTLSISELSVVGGWVGDGLVVGGWVDKTNNFMVGPSQCPTKIDTQKYTFLAVLHFFPNHTNGK